MDSSGRVSATSYAEPSSRTITETIKDIGTGLREIVRSEIELAKTELSDTARRVRSSLLFLCTGSILGLFAIGFLLLAGFFGLEIVLPAWLAALVLGGLLLVGAVIGIQAGRERLSKIRPAPMTLQTVKEDFQWMKEQVRS